MKKIAISVLLCGVVFLLLGAVANKTASDKDMRETLKKNLPGLKIDSVKESPIKGVYEVLSGSIILYVTADGRYRMAGDIIDLQNGGINITTQSVMKTVSEAEMIIFSPPKPEYTLTVFTDTNCGYCRKLHRDVPELNRLGVKVRYLLYPRDDDGSFTSPGFMELQSVWCADNQQEAMNIAKSGGQIPSKKCANPIRKHVELARSVGLQGTPLLVTGKGNLISGYRPVEALMEEFKSGK